MPLQAPVLVQWYIVTVRGRWSRIGSMASGVASTEAEMAAYDDAAVPCIRRKLPILTCTEPAGGPTAATVKYSPMRSMPAMCWYW